MAPLFSSPPTKRTETALRSTEENILRAYGELQVPHFGAEDMTRLLCQNTSKPFIRSLMTGLAGGKDHTSTPYLYRFGKHARSERIYALTRRGRDYVRGLGFDTSFWHPPGRTLTNVTQHNLGIVKTLVALHRFVRDTASYQVLETRTAFTLASRPPSFTQGSDGQETTIVVIPDAWVCLVDASGEDTALWIEVDTGSEAKAKFQYLVLQRINLIRSGQYKVYFDTDSVTFAYLVIGSELHRTARLESICRYTWEVLKAQNLTDWAPSILFSTIEETLYDSHSLFTNALWRGPETDTPVLLLS
jgi:hypothetical protein